MYGELEATSRGTRSDELRHQRRRVGRWRHEDKLVTFCSLRFGFGILVFRFATVLSGCKAELKWLRRYCDLRMGFGILRFASLLCLGLDIGLLFFKRKQPK
ncbi:hypothetical protein Ddye_030813 [Dipteronia dyeriana]|uniref:Transmembrane protein n=1 Tax=Dipteronia dyeriana TaxID=168575 RepID=A0AAD9THS3_9ROSI|nr:hypothetical protein Ddye_030813 [Dipteronia dyeriana]